MVNRDELLEENRMAKCNSYIGVRFGRVTINKYAYSKKCPGPGYRLFVNTTCDCGCIKDIELRSLLREKVKSCGCLQKDIMKVVSIKNRKPGTLHNILFSQYKNSANVRGVDFQLNLSEFSDLLNGNCFYCGCLPENRPWKNKRTCTYLSKTPQLYNGIDRRDNSFSYTPDNSVSCCQFCNYAKSDWTEAEFLDKVSQIYKHQHKNEISNH